MEFRNSFNLKEMPNTFLSSLMNLKINKSLLASYVLPIPRQSAGVVEAIVWPHKPSSASWP